MKSPRLVGRRILVLYTPRERTPNREARAPEVVAPIARGLARAGALPTLGEYHPDGLSELLEKARADLVFHLAYGFVDRARGLFELQPRVTERLENRGVRFLGSSAAALAQVQDKLACAEVLARSGIASPATLDPGDLGSRRDRVLIKPRFGSCHRGIRIVDPRVEALDLAPDDLVQEWVEGPEITTAVLARGTEVEVLPPLEIVFESAPPHAIGVAGTVFDVRPARHDPFGLVDLSRRVFRALGLRHYARIDFRVGSDGPVVLDVNGLPNLHPQRSFFPLAAAAAGIDFDTLVARLASAALDG